MITGTLILMLTSSSADDSWWERIGIKGDFRFRHETTDQAYFDFRPNNVEGLSLIGGKMKNTLFSPEKTGD